MRLDQNETESALKVYRGDTGLGNRPTAPIFNVFNGTGGSTEVFRVQGDGKVGIGTTGPDASLHIEVKDTSSGIDSANNVGTAGAVLRLTHDAQWQADMVLLKAMLIT